MKRKVAVLSLVMLFCMMIFTGCKGKNETKAKSDEYTLKDYKGVNLKNSYITISDSGEAEETYKSSKGEVKVKFIIENEDGTAITQKNMENYKVIDQQPEPGSKFSSSESKFDYAEEVKLKVKKVSVSNSSEKDKSKESTADASTSSTSVTNSETKKETPEESKAESKESTPKSALWNNQKDTELAGFMQNWSASMNQQPYLQGKVGQDINFFGLSLPSDIGVVGFSVNDQPVSMVFSPDGIGNADYVVVATYRYISGAKNSGWLYLFCYQNGQPVVLVTGQNQGMPDGRIHFKFTENQDLINEFSALNS
ncbi:DUF4767 domain-containing protein [Floricoccus penangensis]|uniref:DUF4767 domain-containing protein n=1 Tax=Floricoccus penangensis TaxID=1859475 RepID=UPI00203DBD1C|nr:DUF4767 domain-containing protein [Floricoccus penangensis]URZ88080.1 DUF4767 domain-containing protein [Floricoccus penangensis]